MSQMAFAGRSTAHAGEIEALHNEGMRMSKTAFRDRLLNLVRDNPVPWTLFLATTLAAIGIAVWG